MVKTIDRKAIQQSMIADTYGWDTVYAIKYPDVNSAIANSGVSQTLPQLVQTDGATTITVNQGDFGDWSLAMGGDGQNVRMLVPITNMTFDTGTPRTFSGLTATIEVCLQFIPQRDPTVYGDQKDAEWMELRIATAPRGDNAADSAVSVLDLTGPAPPFGPDPLEAEQIKTLLAAWFNDEGNLKEFNHVFAAVNLNDKAGVDEYARAAGKKANDFKWLKPKMLGYAVADGATLADSVFAVLAITERDAGEPEPDPETLFHRVSANAIPEGKRSAFLLSKERYLSKLLLPGAGIMFTGPIHEESGKSWPKDYFELEDSGAGIRNTADIYIDKLDVGGNTQRAEVKAGNFAVHLRDECLEIEFIDMHHPFSSGLQWIDTFHSIRSQAVPRLQTVETEDESGKFEITTFDLEPSTAPNAIHTHEVIAVKNSTMQWVQIGILGVGLVFTVIGLGQAIKAFSAGERIVRVSGNVANISNAATAGGEAIPAAQAGAAAASGCRAALAVVGGKIVDSAKFLFAYYQVFRATFFSTFASILGISGGVIALIESIANKEAAGKLPNFKEFAATVMAPVRWPTEESEFTPDGVCFNGSFQISGNPDFAD